MKHPKAFADQSKTKTKRTGTGRYDLPESQWADLYDTMLRSRLLEERLIRMYKQNDGYFWIGGPGEEALQIPLGTLVHKGQGCDYDFLHLHYRSSGVVLAMGAQPIDFIRQMKNVASDPFSGGRNFGNHPSVRKWNVVPTSSTIETQFATAIGTGIAQKQHGGQGITIVTGGDAGTAEGEFASCLVWSSRPQQELPILMVVANNGFGISTPAETQHGEKLISDRGIPFGIRSLAFNGNDVEESYRVLAESVDYVRNERRPCLLEARVTRLYGHSSASGANLATGVVDPLENFEQKVVQKGILTPKQIATLKEQYTAEFLEISKQVKQEAMPDPSTIYDHTFYQQYGKYL